MSNCKTFARLRGMWLVGLLSASTLGGSASVAQNVTPVPDFSGLWGRNSLDYEAPASGRGPIVNLSRFPNGTRNMNLLVGDYNNPILRPHAAEVLKKNGEMSLRGELFPDPHNSCWPESPPYILRGMEIQIVQIPEQVLIFYRDDHEVRRIRIAQSHAPRVRPSAYGESFGHWEGDTLVVDTIGIKVERYSVIDQYGTPHSPSLHLVERYRLIDGRLAKEAMEKNERENGRIGPLGGGATIDPNDVSAGLQVQFTVEDPDTFTAPWSGAVTYRRNRAPWTERVCAENVHDYAAGMDTDVPTAATPDF
jgi:hypothetical protein